MNMTWITRFLPWGNDSPVADAPTDSEVSFKEAHGVTIDPDEDEWRRIGGDNKRDLSPMTQLRMQKLSVYLWESNLLANRIVELPLAFLLAEGVRLVAVDETVQDMLDKFWHDPINQMDIKLVKKARELSLYGEQCWPTFVNELNGHVRLGYLDPANIATVVMDPDNAEQPIGVVTTKNGKGDARRYRVIVNGDEQTLFTERTRTIRETFSDGEAFYFTVNDLSNGSRGRSDLLAQIDWLDAFDQFLFGEIDRAQFMRAFMWDITLTGATPEDIKERAKQIRPPSPNSVRIHNDAEKWEAVTPDLKAGDSSENARLFRNHVMGGATLPEHWYGGGGDVNRATASEMSGPTFKMFKMRQTHLGYILCEIAKYVIRQNALVANDGEPDLFDELYAFDLQWPDMVDEDISGYAQALMQVTTAAALMITNGLLSRKRALQIIEKVSARLGIEFDADTELAAALEDAAADSEKDAFTTSESDPVDA